MIKKLAVSTLKIGLPLALGVYLVWYFFDTLTPEQKNQIAEAVKQANYWWVLLSAVPAILSHVSRAYRWKYTLEPLGYKPDFFNSFFSVMIGYSVNLAIPRLGEISRCGFMNRYDKMPFDKLIGTVIAERLADAIILLATITATVLIQYDLISDFVNGLLSDKFGNISGTSVLIAMGGLLVGGLLGLYLVYKIDWKIKLFITIQNVIKGVISGVASILTMKNKGWFLAHTAFIWLMYFYMLYFNFFALEETSSISFSAALTAFTLGGLAMALTNGGIGAYPLAIQAALSLYGFSEAAGGALGWIMWIAQTLLIIVLGAGSMLLMPIYNKRKNANSEADPV
ncbi:MAG: lysylphosphatidylglycerol synthase transmembrane domain-containing protein [Salibacteraceae bacterium]